MPMNQIETFMAAIRRLESGSFEGNYTAQGPTVPSGMYAGDRAVGAYQIMSKNWSAWAAEAGLSGASWRNTRAQDAVAKYKFSQYYNRYGDWRLVAIAWFAGPGRADRAARKGLGALSGIADVTGTSVPRYVQLIDDYMGEAVERGYGPPSSRTDLRDRLDPQAQAGLNANDSDPYAPVVVGGGEWNPDTGGLEQFLPGGEDVQAGPGMKADDVLRAIFTGLSNRIRKGAAAAGDAPVDTDDLAVEEDD